MESSKIIWKTIPVWFIIIILLTGVIGASIIWFGIPEVPARYDEPFHVQISDELREDEWISVSDFPETKTKEPIDLTYGRFHDYLKITNERNRRVNVSVEIEAIVDGAIEKNDVGFAIFDGIIRPQDISVEKDTLEKQNQTEPIMNGSHNRELTLEKDETSKLTIVNIFRPSRYLNQDEFDLRIGWNFIREDPVSDPSLREIPRTIAEDIGPEIYNYTPLNFLIAIIGTIIASYIFYKKILNGSGGGKNDL